MKPVRTAGGHCCIFLLLLLLFPAPSAYSYDAGPPNIRDQQTGDSGVKTGQNPSSATAGDSEYGKAEKEMDEVTRKHNEYKKNKAEKAEAEKKALSKESMDSAIKKAAAFLRRMGNEKGAKYVEENYGSTINFGSEDSSVLGYVTVNRQYAKAIAEGKDEFRNIVALTRAIVHETEHTGQWRAVISMTSNANEKDAWLGTQAILAQWMQQLQKELEAKSGKPPCEQADSAADLRALVKELETYDDWIKEKSPEENQRKKNVLQDSKDRRDSLLRDREKVQNNINVAELYQWGAEERLKKPSIPPDELKEIYARHSEARKNAGAWKKVKQEMDREVSDLEGKIRNLEGDLENPTVFDSKDFRWTDDKGKTYDRGGLLKKARELEVNAAAIEEACKKSRAGDEPPKQTAAPEAKKQCSELNEKQKGDLFGSLCRCSCNSGVGGGASYDAEAGCVCTGVIGGKWIVGMITSGECFKGSTASAGASEEDCGRAIKDMNRQWAERLIQKAKDLIEDFWTALPGLGQGKKGEKGAAETQKERIERKLGEGDLDKAAAYAKSAAEMYPPLESTAKAVIPGSLPWRLTSLALTLVPPLEFGTSRRLLERTTRLDEENQHVKENLGRVVQWEKEWNQIKLLSEECFSLIKANRPCECQRLFDGKIDPLHMSFRIPTGNMQPGRVLDDGRTIMEREYLPIPEKDALRLKLVFELDKSRRNCRYQPGLSETISRLESYTINKAGPGLSDQAIADMAKKVLEREGLCDCERGVAEKALEIANKGISEQGPPLAVSIEASRTLMKIGETITVTPVINGGAPPYSFTYRGYWGFDVVSGGITGAGQTPTSLKAKMTGKHPLEIIVNDSRGKSASGRIDLTVEAAGPSVKPPASPPVNPPVNPPGAARLDVTVMSEKSMLYPGENSYITASVSGGRPSYRISWRGAAKGEGTSILFKADKPGLQTITAEVSDADGNRASGSVKITVGKSTASADRKPPVDKISAPPQPPKPPKKTPPSHGGYNIFDDPNIKMTKNVPVDTASVIKHGDEFQTGPGKKNTGGSTGAGTAPISQPDTYTGKTAPQDSISTIGKQDPYSYPPVYSPAYPHGEGGSRTKGWTNWSNNKGAGPGGYQGESPATTPKAPPTDKGMGTGTVPGAGQLTVQAVFKNTSKEEVHIFADRQDNFGPQNKLRAGDKRTVGVKITSGDGQLRFIAGRNGQRLTDCSWSYLSGDISGRYPVVNFTQEGKLLCTTGLR